MPDSSTVPIYQNSIILEGLNPSQIEAVTQPQNAITRVIAGPGSGKTRVLTCRVAYLLEQDPRSRVLAVTFTKKAADEMRHRVEALLLQQQQQQEQQQQQKNRPHSNSFGISNEDMASNIPNDLGRVTMGTFHSICAKVLRFNGELLETLPSVKEDMVGQRSEAAVNLDGSFAILDASDQLRILKECLDEQEIDLKKSGVKPMQILSAISSLKEAQMQGKDLFNQKDGNNKKKEVSKALKLARGLYSMYREKLLSNNALDFDDLIFMTREMLIQHPTLRERLHNRWPHVLVDEFQDTSVAQMDLVKLLTSSSLLVVGDGDQSIYSWRGAHAGSLSDFRTEFQEFNPNGVQTVHLKENYRSTSNIVNAAEKVIAPSPTGKNDDPRRAMTPKRGSGPSPRVVACADEKAEAQFVADTIFDMITDGSLRSQNTVAIIYRTNAQSRYLEEACVARNLPYVIRGGAGGFYKRAEIKDCLCFLRWIYNGNDESAMLRAFRTPSRGIGDKAVEEFKAYCTAVEDFYRQSSIHSTRPAKLEVLLSLAGQQDGDDLVAGAPDAQDYISKRAMKNFAPFAAQMKTFQDKARSLPVETILFKIIQDLDLLSHFDSISKSRSEYEERRENVQELRNAAKRYSNQGPALLSKAVEATSIEDLGVDSPLGNFLDDISLVSDVAPEQEDSSEARLVVNLMTIHASKGTEFDTVFVVGNEEGTLPSNLSIQEGEDSVALQEERRLCYVAMTRAKTNLIMSWRKEVTAFASWSADGPKTSTKSRSRFLDALVKKKAKGAVMPARTGSKGVKPIDSDSKLRQRRPANTSAASAPMAGRQSSAGIIPRRGEELMSKNPVGQTKRNYSSGTPSLHKPPTSAARKRVPLRQEASRTSGYNGAVSSPSWAASPPRKTVPAATSVKPPTKNLSQLDPGNQPINPLDSTIFFPVGSDVTHNNFGTGVVLTPPPVVDGSKSLVRVQFNNGKIMEFPVETRDLLPVF